MECIVGAGLAGNLLVKQICYIQNLPPREDELPKAIA